MSQTSTEISLIELFDFLKERKVGAVKMMGISLLIGLIIAFTTPKEWRSYSEFIPESTNNSGVLGGALGGVAGLAGLELGEGQDGTFNPELYAAVLNSTPFLMNFLEHETYFESIGQEIKVRDYLKDHLKTSLVSRVIGFPKRIQNIFSSKGGSSLSDEAFDPGIMKIGREDIDLIETIKSRIGVDYNKGTSVVFVSFTMQDPMASAVLTEYIIEYLTAYVSDYQTSKQAKKLQFIQGQVKRKEVSFLEAQRALAAYRDSNLGLSNNLAQTELKNLQSQYDLEFNLYSSLKLQEAETRIKVEENTPVFKVLEPVKVPVERFKPKRKMILIIAITLGFLAWVLFVSIKFIIRTQLSPRLLGKGKAND
ncbi:hypothetical protein [Roseivirga pacifica]|uniref:hypothetical protein n=1 Tax=Roseivirga pacifica TaxID=1267423 RepID=UPI00227AB566|nr:hypothetical protein [Roseivirga pacifica]